MDKQLIENLRDDIEKEYGEFTPTVAIMYTDKIQLETYLRIKHVIDGVKDSDHIEERSKLEIVDRIVTLEINCLKGSLDIDDQNQS